MRATVCSVIGTILVLAVTTVHGQTTRIRGVTPCTTSNACFPWSSRGPYCGRGANINLRFQLQITQPNWIVDSDRAEPYSNLTYAFCPRVDELQAFNITRAGEFSFTFVDPNTDQLQWMLENHQYLSVIGMGDTFDVDYPQEASEGRAMVADWSSRGGSGDARQCPEEQIAVVPFLILNISLDDGRFNYFPGHPQPGGVGFAPSCDETDVCMLDSSMKCIGDSGRRNCAECVDKEVAAGANVQVWVSYYGTDASGRTLRSGASNPLNFQAYSGSGVGVSMRRSFNNLENGRSNDPDGLEPA